MAGIWNFHKTKNQKRERKTIYTFQRQAIYIQTHFLCKGISWICGLYYGESSTHDDLVKFREAVGVIVGQSANLVFWNIQRINQHIMYMNLPPYKSQQLYFEWTRALLFRVHWILPPSKVWRLSYGQGMPFITCAPPGAVTDLSIKWIHSVHIWMWTHVWRTWWPSWITNFGAAGSRGTQLHKLGGDQAMWCNPDMNWKWWLWLEGTYIGFLTRRHNQWSVSDTHCILLFTLASILFILLSEVIWHASPNQLVIFSIFYQSNFSTTLFKWK